MRILLDINFKDLLRLYNIVDRMFCGELVDVKKQIYDYIAGGDEDAVDG